MRALAALLVALGLLLVPASADAARTPVTRSACAHAWKAPDSRTARVCRQRGWVITARVSVGQNGWVRHSTLPRCAPVPRRSMCIHRGPGLDYIWMRMGYGWDGLIIR